MTEPLETAELLAFTKTVEAQSLSRAALELGIPRATLSRRLARLEERLGARLLRRTTRSLRLTDAGDALYRHARIALDAVTTAEASVRAKDDVVRGDLRVSVPPLMNASFNAMIFEFARRYPAVRMHIQFSSQYVDLQRGGYDVALRASTALEPGLVARPIMRDALIAVASPSYLAAHGTPKTRKDLRHHRCLLAFTRGEIPATHWPLSGGRKLRVDGCFFSNDIQLLCDGALSGHGIALLPSFLVGSWIESGELVHVLRDLVKTESTVAVVYPERELLPPQVRAFVDTITEWATKEFAAPAARERCGGSREKNGTSKRGK